MVCLPMGSILVVEDDAPIRESLKIALESEGYEVRTAEHGRDALNKLDSLPLPPGLILLDVMMPEMTGLEFLEAILEHPTWGQIPIIVMSALGLDAVPPPARTFLRKPIDLDHLLNEIRTHLSS